MKRIFILFTILTAALSLTASEQAGPATVKGHTLGESVAPFAKVIGYNLDACPQVLALTLKEAKKQKLEETYAVCKNFIPAQNEHLLTVASYEEITSTFRKGIGTKHELRFFNSDRDLSAVMHIGVGLEWFAVIEDQKLVEFRIAPDSSKYSFADIATELTQKYGEPTTKQAVPYQNGFGAKFETELWAWKLSDGSTIIAEEVFGYSNTRMVVVSYFIAGRFEKEANKHKVPNALD